MNRSMLLLAAILVAGCSSPYSVHVDGDVLGSDAETPREVRAGIYPASEASNMIERARDHLHPLGDATVTVRLVHARVTKLQSKITELETLAVDSRTGHFRCNCEGQSANGRIEAVLFMIESPGREPVMRQLAVTGGGLSGALVAVLDAPPRPR